MRFIRVSWFLSCQFRVENCLSVFSALFFVVCFCLQDFNSAFLFAGEVISLCVHWRIVRNTCFELENKWPTCKAKKKQEQKEKRVGRYILYVQLGTYLEPRKYKQKKRVKIKLLCGNTTHLDGLIVFKTSVGEASHRAGSLLLYFVFIYTIYMFCLVWFGLGPVKTKGKKLTAKQEE